MKLILVDDEEMQTLCDNLMDYPQFGHDNVLKFGADKSIVEQYLLKKGDEIDIAILDQFIGSNRGTDLGGWININFPHIACILLTGGGTDADSINQTLFNICKESMEKGFVAFMLKSHECSDKKILYESLDRILDLPSVQGKQKAKKDKLLGITLESMLLSKYKEGDLYATEFCLHCIQLIAKVHFIRFKDYPEDALYYSKCFKNIENDLQFINLKDNSPPVFSLRLLGDPHSRLRYGEKMELLRKYFNEYNFEALEMMAKTLRTSKTPNNVLHLHFSKQRNKEITYVLFKKHPEQWELARQYFPPIKKIIAEFKLEASKN